MCEVRQISEYPTNLSTDKFLLNAKNALQFAWRTGRHERRQGQGLTLQNLQSNLGEKKKKLTYGIIWKDY